MASISKWIGIPIENIAKINGINIDDIAKLNSEDVDTGVSGSRGVLFGGYNAGAYLDTIDYISIDTLSNASPAGNLIEPRQSAGALSNGTNQRAVISGGKSGSSSYLNSMEFMTINTLSAATLFGNAYNSVYTPGAASNDINERGIFFCGWGSPGTVDAISYITINTLGNALSYFTNETELFASPGTSNATNDRAVFYGGHTGNSYTGACYHITVSSGGNSSYWSGLNESKRYSIAISNKENERGVVFGGDNYNHETQGEITYNTINTLSSASAFGIISGGRRNGGNCSSGIWERGLCCGGSNNLGIVLSQIDYVTINSQSDSIVFGNLTVARAFHNGGCDNS